MAILGVFKMNPHIAPDLLKIYQYMSLYQLKNMKLSGIKQFQSKKMQFNHGMCLLCSKNSDKNAIFGVRKVILHQTLKVHNFFIKKDNLLNF